jgi:hypothetical protein
VIELGDAAEIATSTEPDFVESCAEVAFTVAVPMPEGVKTPELLTFPPVADHATAEL